MVTASTVAWVLQEDPIEEFSNLEGVEHEGLFVSRYAPALSTPTSVSSSRTPAPLDSRPVPAPAREAPVETEKKTRKTKERGKQWRLPYHLPLPTSRRALPNSSGAKQKSTRREQKR